MSDAVAADFRAEPWWWEAAPRDHSPPPPLPARADVAIVGSGYAGLAAAVTLARAGRHVVVLDAGAPGSAASSRSVGMVGGRLRQSPGALTAALGAEAATALMREANAAYGWFRDFVRDEGILCDLVRTGRLVCAWTARDLDRLRGLSRLLGERVGIESHVVDRAGLAREIATDLFHGALVLPGDGGVHPARLHDGLLQAARKAGAVVIPFTRVDGIDETASGVELKTAQGRLAAGEAILATNAYTGAAFPWHHRRIIPVGSYMAATEPVPGATLRRLLPQGRLVNDTRRLAYAVRISPDGRRLLVGGRASARDHAAPRTVARSLHRMLCMTFPELAPVKMTHAWGGMVAFTLDRLPNIGTRGRVHHVLGCNGSGVVMATYLGTITARRLMRANDATTAFARDGLPDHPLYGGRPWFMAPLSAWYGLRDRVDRLADGFRSSPRPGASAR